MLQSFYSASTPKRGDEIYEGTVGKVLTPTPRKRDDKKSATISQPLGYNMRRANLLAMLQGLESRGLNPPEASTIPNEDGSGQTENHDVEMEVDPMEGLETAEPTPINAVACGGDVGQSCDTLRPTRGCQSDKEQAFSNWKKAIPTLAVPYLNYLADTMGKRLLESEAYQTSCRASACPRKVGKFVGLHADRKSP
jgi:hypothetical protein